MISLLALLDPVPMWLPVVATGALAIMGVAVALWRELVASSFWLAVWAILSRGPLSGVAETVDLRVAAFFGAF